MNLLTGNAKVFVIIAAIGMAVYQTVDLCPIAEWIPWIKWLGAILGILGGGSALIGVSGNVSKMLEGQRTLMRQVSMNAPLSESQESTGTPLTEERFWEILKQHREKRNSLSPKG
jgi:hypothetical protein